MRLSWCFLATIIVGLSVRSAIAVEGMSADDARIDRLARVCKVWGTVRYLHPYLAYKEIDWDAALIKTLPKVRVAKDSDEFVRAVQEMLNALGDPSTRVIGKPGVSSLSANKPSPGDGKRPNNPADRADESPIFTWIEGDVLAVFPNRLSDGVKLAAAIEPLRKEVGRAKAVILDLRIRENYSFSFFSYQALTRVQDLLISKEVHAPVQRTLMHSGYRPQSGATSGAYYSAFITTIPEAFAPGAGTKPRKIVFLFNSNSIVPPIAVALQSAGSSFFVSQGPFREESLYATKSIELAEGVSVSVRTSEQVASEGAFGITPDREVPADAEWGVKGAAFAAALELIRAPAKAETALKSARVSSITPVWRPDKTYDDIHYPDPDYRLLALFRFWNVIHYFYPYKDLLDDDWDQMLRRFIPKLEAARDAREYELALAEFATHVSDGHTSVTGPELTKFWGAAPPPVQLRMVEKFPVVTLLLDETIAKKAGVRVGDIVVSVDGEVIEDRMKRIGKYIASSTPQWHEFVIARRLMNGKEGSTIKIGLRGGDDKVKVVTLTRMRKYLQPTPENAANPVYRVLPGNIGYVDLERLTVLEVDSMFEAFKDTKSIIFDLRNYPQGTAWAIAPRLNVKGARNGALFHRQLVQGSSFGENSQFSFYQPLPKTDQWKYKGKTVTLIDERAVSQSEHTGLFFEAACGTTFIGSPTAGANGDVTNFTLPGGLSVRFTGHDVRHADGRQLQRIGLVPHIEVRPTIRGIREGKDEVLERAISFLTEGK